MVGSCLRALVRQQGVEEDWEVIVVDDGSDDDTATAAATAFPSVRIFSQPHSGPAVARNYGVREARGDVICFLDADCEPAPDWLYELTRPLREDQGIAATKGVYRTRQRAWPARFAQLEFEGRYRVLSRHREITFIDSYSAAIRREAFLAVGGFDPHFPMADHEDVDLSFKLARAGYKMVFCPRAVVYHRHRESWRQYFLLKARRAYWRARVYRRFPERILSDTYTPHVTKLQLLLMGTAVVLTGAAAVWRPAVWGAAAAGVTFVLSTVPCLVRTLGSDPPIALVVLPALVLRTLLTTAGAAAGFLHRYRRDLLFPVLHVVCDTAAVVAAVHGVYWLRAKVLLTWAEPLWHPLWLYQEATAVVAVIWWITFAYLGLYGAARTTSFVSELVRVLRGTFFVVVAVMAASYAVKFEFSRLMLALFGVTAFTFAAAERYSIRVLKDVMQRRGLFQTRVVVVGTGDVARAVADRVASSPSSGYRLAGFVDDGPPQGDQLFLGNVDNIAQIVREYYVDEILVAKPSMSREAVLGLIAAADETATPVKVLFGPLEFGAGGLEERFLGDIPVLDFGGAASVPARRFVKRWWDVVLALLFAPALMPLAIIVTALALIVTRRWPLRRRLTPGRSGEPFFRWVLDVGDDNRFARFLNYTGLNNIVSWFSVLTGGMSVVGPRPATYDEYRRHFGWRRFRYRYKPGLVGFWYIGPQTDVRRERELEYDLFYAYNQNSMLDFTICLKTLGVFFQRAWEALRLKNTPLHPPAV